MRHGAYRPKYPLNLRRKNIGKSFWGYPMPKKLQLQKLVGGIPTPLKHISQWEGLSHILWKKCLKPPTSSNSWLQILIHIAGQAGRSRKNRSLSCFIYVQYIHERPAIASHEPWNIPLSHSIKNTGQLQTIEWISSSSSKQKIQIVQPPVNYQLISRTILSGLPGPNLSDPPAGFLPEITLARFFFVKICSQKHFNHSSKYCFNHSSNILIIV